MYEAMAIPHDDLDVLKAMLASSPVPEFYRGMPLLCYAAAEGYTEIVTELVRRGADLYAKTPLGQTALELAIESGYTHIVEILFHASIGDTIPHAA